MISGANEEELKIANERADLLLENQQLKDRINKAIKELSNIELTQYELLNLDKDGVSMIKKEDVNKIIKSIKILKVDNKEEVDE